MTQTRAPGRKARAQGMDSDTLASLFAHVLRANADEAVA